MATVYASFLREPAAAHLASDASIHYITTTTSIAESTAILKHLQAQAKQVVKKEERVLNTVETHDALVLETETTLQFNNGGGAYLPAMDENLLDEKLVTFPLLHVVSLNAEQKIKQIRLYWDQGTLLKQVEAIGKTGRNWPIRDGKAQVEAISKSVKAGGGSSNGTVSIGPRGSNDVVVSQHKSRDNTSPTRGRDPHASLDLFARRDPNADTANVYDGPTLAPRESARPEARDMNDLFAGEGARKPAGMSAKARSPSPTKGDVVLKSGAGQHHMDNRLFDENDSPARSPERKKTYAQKYDHFAFGNGEDAPQNTRPSSGKGSKGSKGAPTFSFEDFTTPPKYQYKARRDDQIHWGPEDEPPASPPKQPVVHAARKDADTHFSMADRSSPATAAKGNSTQGQNGTGLYKTLATDDEGVKQSSSITNNVNNTRRGEDFGAHYSMTDRQVSSPDAKKHSARPDTTDHWEFGTPQKEEKIYKTAGDGMGRRKGAETFSIFGEPDAEPEKSGTGYKTAGNGMGGRGARSYDILGDDYNPDAHGANERAEFRSRGRTGQQRQQAQAGLA